MLKKSLFKSNLELSNESDFANSSVEMNAKLTKKAVKPLQNNYLSEVTTSRLNFQFQEIKGNQAGVFKMKNQKDLLTKAESNTFPIAKEKGYDFTSSTNSHFTQMLITVPKKFKAKCSSTSTITRFKKSQFSTISKTCKQSHKSVITISKEMIDDKHKGSEKPINFHGYEWHKSCKESFVAEAPRKFMGTCPPKYEKISKMSKTRQKFFLTQDPRKVHCLVNPEVLHSKKYSKKDEFNAQTKMVKHAQNICASTASESSEDFICEVIDLENPLQLDFQGLDYSNTYERDEQDFENQRNFRKVCRYMERRRVKAGIKANVEEEIHTKIVNVPKCFEVRNRNIPVEPPLPEIPIILSKLYRSADKPYNKKCINMEKERRRRRYKDLYLRMKARQEQEKFSNKIHEELEADNLAINFADKNLKKLINTIDEYIQRSTGKELILKKSKIRKRKFPRTMKETKKFKGILKQKNFALRDKAEFTKRFFLARRGKVKEFPEANLEISSDKQSDKISNISGEQSTDDEDGMEVGKQDGKFKLRGFQFKLGTNLRGKLSQYEKLQNSRKEKSCITREQWLKDLAPKKQQIKVDEEIGILKPRSPDDPQLVLFPPSFGFKLPQVKYSPIKEFRSKPLGHHYNRTLRKTLKFAKPHLRYSVKKFNLISYRFGDTAKRFSHLKDSIVEVPMLKLKSTNEFMQAKVLKEKRKQEDIKQNRLKLLGISYRPVKESLFQKKCKNSSASSDSDWVPSQEDDFEDDFEDRFRQIEHEIRPLRMRYNMPAPKFREPTLRQHPRNPRDYKNLRVPSELFDQVVLTTNFPYMHKLDQDKIQFANVETKKRPYTDKFEARHHHDHWIPTQVKQVNVHYQAHVIKPQITKIKTKSNGITKENSYFANPPCNKFVDMNLTLPQYDIENMIKSHKKITKTKSTETAVIKTRDLCTQQSYSLRSRDSKELQKLDYPGRQEYLQLLKDVKESFKDNKHQKDTGEKLYVDNEAILKGLEEDLKSIESCLTSLSSSVCTNLSNDSGSFILLEGKEKIPLDYIRKSIVPFEELQRSCFQAIPLDVNQVNPYQVLPFSGQKKDQMELITSKDKFFTFNTRLKNGLRLRLEVPVEDVREKLLGKGTNKYKGIVTTDIDEDYVEELKNRPPIKQFKFKSGQTFIKDALRLKFESMLIQEQIVRTKICDRLNEQHWLNMQRIKDMFEKLFAKWGQGEYDATMAVVYEVKNFFEETDRLKLEFKQLERDLTVLNMDIVFIENHWMRCVMLQNFHYLMGSQEWRLKHDWIHRLPSTGEDNEEIELENFEDSILKRSTLNIRKKEKDDAWAIKAFYEEVYSRNKHPNLIVFPNGDSFLAGLENLKTKTFILLLEMHFTFAIHTELHYKLKAFIDWCTDNLKEKQEYVSRKCAKLYFMSDRVNWLEQHALRFLENPIEESFNLELLNQNRAIITGTWRRIVPANMSSPNEHELSTVEMVAKMSEVVLDLIAKFETVPMEISCRNEHKLRARRAYLSKQSHQAYHIERRMELEIKKVVKNLEPPFQKPKRTSKLPRYYTKKHVKIIKADEQNISERAKLFINAFNEESANVKATNLSDSIIQMDGVQEQIIPFYFDHFLKLNGYTPNYNFKTQIELRDGPEIGRLEVKSVIPEIQKRMEQWETLKKKIMEENIAKTSKMYVDVMT